MFSLWVMQRMVHGVSPDDMAANLISVRALCFLRRPLLAPSDWRWRLWAELQRCIAARHLG